MNFSRRRPHRFAFLSIYLPVRSVARRGAQGAFSIGQDIPSSKNTHYFFPPEIFPRPASRGIIEVEEQKAILFEHWKKKPSASARLGPQLPDGTDGQVPGAMGSHRIEVASAIWAMRHTKLIFPIGVIKVWSALCSSAPICASAPVDLISVPLFAADQINYPILIIYYY